jgi:hypothetical protein
MQTTGRKEPSVTVRELIERLRELDQDLPVAVDVERMQLAPVVRVVIYDVPAAVVVYDPEGAL